MDTGKKRKTKKVYTIQVTDEQIKMIRSFSFHADMIYGENRVEEYLSNNGSLEFRSLYSCRFCRKGSYENRETIPHTTECIIMLARQEYAQLNEQFLKAEHEPIEQVN